MGAPSVVVRRVVAAAKPILLRNFDHGSERRPGQYPLIKGQAVHGPFETVERFQGQERALMLASFGVDDTEQIHAEEEFISPLNRFNVTVSRVRALSSRFQAAGSPTSSPACSVRRGCSGTSWTDS
ncbi:MAG: hypothetical protein OXT72_12945 [Gammaproteobacteria bacterium]|nr:hypothetical protein [Gammaproteobacteria bacterium]MDE0247127.1 hypothetical protein [Gammaproteobacteria bacterium]